MVASDSRLFNPVFRASRRRKVLTGAESSILDPKMAVETEQRNYSLLNDI